MENLNELHPDTENSNETQSVKKTKGLNIAATVLGAIALICALVALGYMIGNVFEEEGKIDKWTAFFLILIIFLGLFTIYPGFICGVIAVILSAVAFKRGKQKYSLAILITSISAVLIIVGVFTVSYILGTA